MTTLTITLPTKKSGKLAYFTIQFSVTNFEKVIDFVSNLKTIDELYSNKLWVVL